MLPNGVLPMILAASETATHAAHSTSGRGHASSSDLHEMLSYSSHAFHLSPTHHVMMATSAAVLITMTLALIRAMAGPTVFDRVLALNMFGTKTVLFICVVSFVTARTDFLDLALLYSLMNFIGMVALLRFTQYRSFGEEPA
ncbi:multiple resistance and pH regulation protein F [Rhodopirellula islandica]|uniref:Multiple resistance and pH regulation protein F n=1 Tax=Rhodopirellula islandica TaxID=595434 RepID=A0A0J1B2M6_RHOIS|nr:monovalent cation/H+ antiporter complex subunit F [Rhodopirellula islandica]KLU01175.1 multiple resistance and pH regulation protein F [Rhodopirellula islandica]